MSAKRIHMRLERTPEELARIKAVREHFSHYHPTLEELLATGDYTEPVMHGQYLDVLASMSKLKQERLRAGLSLADVSKRSGMDSAALSRLENGQQPNPTLDTLYRYAAALGKQIVWSFRNAQPSGGKPKPKPGQQRRRAQAATPRRVVAGPRAVLSADTGLHSVPPSGR